MIHQRRRFKKKIQTQNLVSPSNKVLDADSDTQIQVEESSDEDIIRFDTGGTERFYNVIGIKLAMAQTVADIYITQRSKQFFTFSENMILADSYQYQVQLQLTFNFSCSIIK